MALDGEVRHAAFILHYYDSDNFIVWFCICEGVGESWTNGAARAQINFVRFAGFCCSLILFLFSLGYVFCWDSNLKMPTCARWTILLISAIMSWRRAELASVVAALTVCSPNKTGHYNFDVILICGAPKPEPPAFLCSFRSNLASPE